MLVLAFLALPSIFSGFFFKDLFVGFGSVNFADSIFLLPARSHFFEADFLPASWKVLPVFTSFFSLALVIFGFDFLVRSRSYFLG